MADRDYHPKLSRKFDHVTNLLFAGKVIEAAKELASKILDMARETLTHHAPMLDALIAQLWQVDQLNAAAKETARLTPIPEAADKGAETLRRAACELFIKQQAGLASFFSQEELKMAFCQGYLGTEQTRLYSDALEAATTYGEVETDLNVSELLRCLKNETDQIYADLSGSWQMGTPVEDLKVKKGIKTKRIKIQAGQAAPLNLEFEGEE